eukprot:TRINITY_DN1484_c0_g1_i5.p1 TRINITY_DN1484_c0_g1~~TRINITY_DN1484_c0_g1_i5.p1  ORF type:complete len:467 (-),score=81.51 TRINITY_DN1484_c0_g1_i5:326-1726(-)
MDTHASLYAMMYSRLIHLICPSIHLLFLIRYLQVNESPGDKGKSSEAAAASTSDVSVDITALEAVHLGPTMTPPRRRAPSCATATEGTPPPLPPRPRAGSKSVPAIRPATEKVCVIGGTSFLSQYIIKGLLQRGYRVNTTVNDGTTDTQRNHLNDLARDSASTLSIFVGNAVLGTIDTAVSGCDIVIHCASPEVLTSPNPQSDIVDPALKGTQNVCRAARRAGSVKRMVLITSTGGIHDVPEAGHVYTEKDWNLQSSLSRNVHSYACKVAEETANQYIQGLPANERFELVTILPSYIIGPILDGNLPAQHELVHQLLEGTIKGCVNLSWGFVDVRDVADAVIEAFGSPKAPGQRYIITNKTLSMRQLSDGLKKHFPDYDLPAVTVPNVMAFVIATFVPALTYDYLKLHLSAVPAYHNAKAKDELELSFNPIDLTLKDMGTSLIEHHIIEDKRQENPLHPSIGGEGD